MSKPATKPEEPAQTPWTPGAVIGVGTSAGGLDALRSFFANAETSGGSLCYIVVQHLDPDTKSHLPDLLAKKTTLPVVEVMQDRELEPDKIFIIPPGKYLRVRDGHLLLTGPEHNGRVRTPVDVLFRSLAEEYRDRAVGVVLSGSGTDGGAGLRAIAAAGGLCVAQSPSTAQHDGMPRTADETGVLHFSCPVEVLREKVVQSLSQDHRAPDSDKHERDLEKLLLCIKERRGSDFRHYKPNTIVRRVNRRMGILGIRSLEEYIGRVKGDEAELEHFCRDMLIGVTSFFRDPEVFRYFADEIASSLIANAEEGGEIRVWVAGCSTGEEAYSIAMTLLEKVREMDREVRLQIFASDVDAMAVEYARLGVYPHSLTVDIPKELLNQYFHETSDGAFSAGNKLRESIVFANQNLLEDPPFSRVDMVSCRNLLIYLKPEVQESVLTIFHFAIKPDGYLMLGTSEGTGRDVTRFSAISRQHRIYKRLGGQKGKLPRLPIQRAPRAEIQKKPGKQLFSESDDGLGTQVQRWINEHLAPAAVVVNEHQEVMYYSSTAHRFLKIPEGEPTNDLYSMLEGNAAMRIRAMLTRVIRSGEGEAPIPVVLRQMAQNPETPLEARIGVTPFSSARYEHTLYIITFEEISLETSEKFANPEKNSLVDQLEMELRATREDLQSSIEEMEATNEELKASHEESMSVNEELQSANEELETSKEELQSLNEELTTVNGQLREKLDEVESVNNDMNNLLVSSDLGVLFLDTQLRIKKFTPTIVDLYRMMPADLNRPVGDINRKFHDPDLEKNARGVLDRLSRSEKHVTAENGHIYQQRILPYRTHDNRIDGVVITYTDVTELQKLLTNLDRAHGQQSALASLGKMVIEEDDLQEIFDETVKLARQTLNADFAKVLRLPTPDGPMEIAAGVGWDPVIAAREVIDIGTNSQAGYTILSTEPVVVEDLATENRFNGPKFLTDHGVRSGISCKIHVQGGIWGVLGIHSKTPQTFSEQDVAFVMSLANKIGQALRLSRSQHELQSALQRNQFALESSGIGAWEYNPTTGIVLTNDKQRTLLGIRKRDPYTVGRFWEIVHPEDRDDLRRKLENCFADRITYKADFRIILPSGQVRWLHGAGAVSETQDGEAVLHGVNFDITDRIEAEQQLERTKRQLEDEVVLRGKVAEERLKEIRRMTYEMVIAESVERRRLATELHDNLAQLLNLALMRLSVIEADPDGQSPSRVRELKDIIQKANDTTRSVMAQLTPQVLDELGFPPAIDWLAEQTKQLYNLEVRVRHLAEPAGIAPEPQLIVFRAVRELLINVARHAEVDKAEVVLTTGDFGFRIEVRDSGKGFDAKRIMRESNRRYGLLGMHERISHIGGKVEIRSTPGKGCFVALEIPDPTPSEEEDIDYED